MRAQPQRVMFFAFVADPHFDEVPGEHIAFQQKIVIAFEVVQGFAEAAGNLRNLRVLLRRQLVKVLVHRFARIDFVEHAIQTRHEQRGVGEVGVGRGIGRTVLDALGLRVFAEGWDANRRRTIARGIREVDGAS